MSDTQFKPEQLDGARCLIKDSLKLRPPHTLLLLCQTDFAAVGTCIEVAAREMDVEVDLRSFNREDFFSRYPEAFSPENLAASGIPPSGVALVMEWSEETTKARLDLITDLTNEARPWRVASMPGVDLDGLGLSVSDFPTINNYSQNAFALLARAVSATLKTPNPSGTNDVLNIPLRKSYCPIISTGEIDAASWGNFPSGETFVVPDEFRAYGMVTVRGSIPLYPLEASEWIRFELEHGRIIFPSITASSVDLKRRFQSLVFKPGGSLKCANANALAELGIGTNPGVVQLTGKPIFDEKKLGTVHIAVGKNTQFTGPLKSCVHHDIVCTKPTLSFRTHLRDLDLIIDGEMLDDPANAIPKLQDLEEYNLPRNRRLRAGAVAYRYIDGPVLADRHFTINYASSRQKNVNFIIAEGESAEIANEILTIVGGKPQITIGALIGLLVSRYKAEWCIRIIAGLLEYGLLR